jgi:hypothetical protein
MEIEATAAVWEPAAVALPAGVWYESATTRSGDVAEVREANRCMNIKSAGLLWDNKRPKKWSDCDVPATIESISQRDDE